MHSRTVDLDGPVHYIEHEGPVDGPTFVLVHGLGGNHRNWMRLAPLLAAHGRVLVPDMRGFGFTPLGPHRSTVEHNRRLIARFVRAMDAEPAVLLGNSTGGVVSLRLAAGLPDLVQGLVLVDAALPRVAGAVEFKIAAGFAAMLVPGLGEGVARARVRRKGLEGVQRETIELCTVRPESVPDEVFEAHLEMARARQDMPWTQLAFMQLTRSLLPILLRRRPYERVVAQVDVPTLVLHGAQDRLVPVAAARAIAATRPDWDYVELGHLGHAPMLEDPDVLARAIAGWLGAMATTPPARPS